MQIMKSSSIAPFALSLFLLGSGQTREGKVEYRAMTEKAEKVYAKHELAREDCTWLPVYSVIFEMATLRKSCISFPEKYEVVVRCKHGEFRFYDAASYEKTMKGNLQITYSNAYRKSVSKPISTHNSVKIK